MTCPMTCHCPTGKLCQETGVEFKARQGHKRAQTDSDEEEEEGREEDNLDDLYPRMSHYHTVVTTIMKLHL